MRAVLVGAALVVALGADLAVEAGLGAEERGIGSRLPAVRAAENAAGIGQWVLSEYEEAVLLAKSAASSYSVGLFHR